MNKDCIFSVWLKAEGAFAEALDAALEERDWAITSWSDADAGTVTFQEYFKAEDNAALRLAQVDELASELSDGSEYDLELKRIENRDWEEYWKRFFHTEKVSERIVIKPSWEKYDAGRDDLVIEIDPGMSFGTGQHPTTRMCLSMLDEMSTEFSGCSLVDLGCGSGILSIAAAKLGYTDITGVDHDALAVEIAIENSRLNNTAELTDLSVADMSDLSISKKYDVVVINMLASLLAKFAEPSVALLKPDAESRLILSGMLNTQYEETVKLYCGLGLKILDTYQNDQWQSAILVKHET